MSEKQLELEGIGQQLASLSQWKKDNGIYTHHHYCPDEDEMEWSCWDEFESPLEFIERYPMDAMGYGKSQKSAIIDFCQKEQIDLPFWWR